MKLSNELRRIADSLTNNKSLGESESFDWKESEKASKWVEKKNSRGFTVYQYESGDDQIYLAAVKGGFDVLEKYITEESELGMFERTKYKEVGPDDILRGFNVAEGKEGEY
jgi:hypothetical protein